MHLPPLRYRVLITVLTPFIILFTLWQAWKVRDRRFALQRLGFAYPSQQHSPFWIHCASVGEVKAVLPLVDRLRTDPRFSPVLVSTATPTGAEALESQGWQDVEHVYLPMDSVSAVSRAFKRLNPKALLLMETEIWPHLINKAQQLNLPVLVINGRLSHRTMDAPKFFQPVYQQAMAQITQVLAKSLAEKRNFELLGMPESKVEVTGNLKFAALSIPTKVPENVLARPFWLAASTHHDEEWQLCSALLQKQQANSDLLVIAPRHPKRSTKIQNQLKSLGLTVAVRSRGDAVQEHTQIYLADTLGEMPFWLHHAKVVFMGGSLIPIGGHNVLEPAAVGVPIVSGQYLHNFEDEAQLLTASGALHQVNSADEVIDYVETLLPDSERRQQLGEACFEALQNNTNILDRYIKALLPFVPHQQ